MADPKAIRDQFATAAMQALLTAHPALLEYAAKDEEWVRGCAKVAEAAYVMADAMVMASAADLSNG
jgi:hypothetical protein